MLYGLCWLLSYSHTYNVTLEKIGSAVPPKAITLPFLERSEPMSSPDGNFYTVKGDIMLPYLSPADRLIIKTDNCPLSLRINGKPINLMGVFPLKKDCNFQDDEFSLGIKQANLRFGKNHFEITFNDYGGDYGVSIQAKSVFMKKTLIFVAPLIFIWLFIRFIGVKKRDFLSIHTLIAGLLLAGGVFAISLSYGKLSQTCDETSHIGGGMEWWDRGEYTFEAMHTPLARIADAALLYLNNIMLTSKDYRNLYHTSGFPPHVAGNILLGKDGTYIRNLTLARIGTLPFYILAGCIVFIWSNNLFGWRTALASLLLYVTCPVITGHAGLATTDMAYTAMFALAIFAYIKWLEKPNVFNSIFLGLASFLMVMTKLSSLVHFPAAVFLITLWYFAYLRKHHQEQEVNAPACFINGIFIALPCFILLLQSIYYFDNFHAFILGIQELYDRNKYAYWVWFFNKMQPGGIWYFFPIDFLIKSPLPFLIFILIGIFSSLKLFKYNYNHRVFFPILAAIAVMGTSMLSNINIGIRHILPLYPFLAITGGYGLTKMLESKKISHAFRILGMTLLIWQIISFVRIAPDYIAYFNEFAGNHPENIVVESDLDWGQDMLRLEKTLKKYNITEVSICHRPMVMSSVDKIISIKVLPCVEGNSSYRGWVAVGLWHKLPDGNLSWLDKYPYIKVGKGMNLYHIE